MKKVAFAVFAVAYLAALGTTIDGQVPAAGDGPQYVNKVNLVRPPDYREWVFVSSGLGMEYNPVPGTPPVYKVQVGRFAERAEAVRVSARLKAEEQFSPWVTR